MDAGLPHLDHVTSADLDELVEWRPSADQRRNSVFMDATTISIAARLLAGDRRWLTPLTLWDLAAVVDRVIMCDRIYYVGEHLAPAAALNRLLGDDVFVSLPPLSESDDSAPARMYNRRLQGYRHLIGPLVRREELPLGTYWADAVRSVADAWELVTGRAVRPDEALTPCGAQAWFTPRVRVFRDAYCDDLLLNLIG
ncbi:hypothetical protein [Streptomyces sp. NPDC093149]|uniref:hypothetical protein n=1 Tax=Streptomyces sp. NPDC093149 TaxID=3366031 RepID=UPI0037F304E9